MRAWIAFLLDGIESAKKELAGFCVDDGSAEGAGTGSLEGARGEGHKG